jgi:coenzyme F420-0:L-glutamate ligase / coenzyme F420-1:gamma-L-glutamate ligase
MAGISVTSVTDFPEIKPSDDLSEIIGDALVALAPSDNDIIVVAQKIASKAENRFRRLSEVRPSAQALEIAARCEKDPRIVELVLQDSLGIVRVGPGILIAQHRSGHIMANAGIDRSNVLGDEDTVLLLPEDPDRWCRDTMTALNARFGVRVGVVMADSFGRPWRLGTAGVAIGVAGISARLDVRGQPDRFGRLLESTEIGIADEIAAAASLVMGQTNEGIPVCLLRGLTIPGQGVAADLLRPLERDLFRK